MAEDDRIAREREFHNREFEEDSRLAAGMDDFYRIGDRRERRYEEKVLAHAGDGAILEYGCGPVATAALWFARRGVPATAIDLSEVAIERARALVRAEGLEELIDLQVMNGEAMEFPDASFDFVCGSGVLHHLDLDRALGEIARVLKPTGTGVFSEPLGGNPLIELYRRRTPERRSEDEHPLVRAEVERFRRYFGQVEAEYFHLASLAAIPLRKRRRPFDLAVEVLDRVDRRLFELVPPARSWAWFAQLEVAAPRQVAQPALAAA